MITIVVLSALDGHLGQLNGPFTLAVQALDSGSEKNSKRSSYPLSAALCTPSPRAFLAITSNP